MFRAKKVCTYLLSTSLGFLSAAGAESVSAPASRIAEELILADSIEWIPLVREFHEVRCTVSGPDGFYLEKVFQPEEDLRFDPVYENGLPLSDGEYTYELRVIPTVTAGFPGDDGPIADSEDMGATRSIVEDQAGALHQAGRFRIRSGELLKSPEKLSEEPSNMLARPSDMPGFRLYDAADWTISGSLGIGTESPVAPIHIVGTPYIGFADTFAGGDIYDWTVDGWEDHFAVWTYANGNVFEIDKNALESTLFLGWDGRVGLGTVTPAWTFHISRPWASMILEDTLSGQTYGFSNQNDFRFWDCGTTPGTCEAFARVKGDLDRHLWLNADLYLGAVWDAVPKAPLHLFRSDGTARLLVEDTGPAGNRIVMELKNNGSGFFKFTNTFNGQQWTLNPLGNSFTFDNLNFPGQEFRLYNTGRLVITPSSLGSASFDLLTNGDLMIAGNLTAASFVYPSGREAKEDFEPVDVTEILDRVASMEISKWKYKKSSDGSHMGPMAQDFYALFGVGKDDKHLSPTDTAGVALAAIQGLYKGLQEKDAEIAALRARLDEMESLEAELAEIRAMLGDR